MTRRSSPAYSQSVWRARSEHLSVGTIPTCTFGTTVKRIPSADLTMLAFLGRPSIFNYPRTRSPSGLEANPRMNRNIRAHSLTK